MIPFLKKEFRSIFRNGRFGWLLFMSYLIPFAVFYLLFQFSGQLIQQQIEGTKREKIKIAWVSKEGEASEIRESLKRNLQIQLIDSLDEDELEEALEKDSIAAGIVIAENFDSSIAKKEKTSITLYSKGNTKAVSTVQKNIVAYRREISKRNLSESNLPESIVNPIEINEKDLSSIEELIDNISDMLKRTVAVMLSLLLLIFGTAGARFALNRVFWAEKSLGLNLYYRQASIATISIFTPKIVCAAIFSYVPMLLSLLGFVSALSINQEGIIQGIIDQLKLMLGWNELVLILCLALPLAILFTGFWGFLILIFRRNVALFLSNLVLMLLIVSFILIAATVTGLNYANAFLPFLNIVISVKSIMSSEINMANIALAIAVTLLWGIVFNVLTFIKFKKFD